MKAILVHQIPKRTFAAAVILFTGILAWLLVGVKTSQCSFTHDESLSYNRYVHQSFMEIVSYATPYTNNHILNTLLMKLWESCFGVSEWALRLQSVLAFAGYLLVTARMTRRLPGGLWMAGFVLLTANPYLLDFFGLARGYGLSIGFLAAATWFLFRSLEAKHLGYLAGFNAASLLACWSNFSLINFYLSALGAFYLVCLLERPAGTKRAWTNGFLRATAVNFVFVLGTVLILWEPLRKTHETQVLDFGGKAGFVADTVVSLLRSSLYHIEISNGFALAISWSAVAVTIASAGYWMREILKNQSSLRRLRFLVLVNTTLIGIAVLTVVQHLLLHNDYFIGRFALFMLPLFVLNTLLFFADLYQRGFLKKPIMGFVSGLGVAMLVVTAVNFNMHAYLDWEYDRDTKHVMALLKDHHDRTIPDQHVRLGAEWLFEPTANFYRHVWKMSWLQEVDREETKPGDAYGYARMKDIASTHASTRMDTLFAATSGGYGLVYTAERR